MNSLATNPSIAVKIPDCRPSAAVVFFLFTLSFLLAGCGAKTDDDTTTSAPPVAAPPPRAPAPRTKLQLQMEAFADLPYEHEPTRRPIILSERIADRRDWLDAVLRKGYDQTGHANRQWDAAALSAFQAYADYTRVSADMTNYSKMTNAVALAISEGCDDPMIRYMRVRYGLSPEAEQSQEQFALASMDRFRAIVLSRYHPVIKFMVGYRAVSAARTAEPKGNRSRPIDHVTAAVEDLARDTNAPADEVFEPVYMWVEFSTGIGWAAYVMSDVEDFLRQNWGHDARFFQLRGLAEIDRAWHARGGGYANTVTDVGWEQFQTHMNQATLALESAWSLDSSNAYTAYLMMKVELGQGQGRARMEKWFNRAMALAPNYYDAVDLMEFYLQPRWYGSDAAALEFARSCVRSTKWGGQVPLVLENLHHSLAKNYELDQSPKYWQRPGVWEDVRSSYEKFLKLNPTETGYRHGYARDAYLCGRYAEFVDEVKLFPSTNYQFFGGEAKFNEMLQRASK